MRPSIYGRCLACTLVASLLCLPADPAEFDARELNSYQTELRGLIERYGADRISLSRTYPVADSPARSARMRKFCEDWLAALDKVGFDALGEEGRVDYVLLRSHLQHERKRLDLEDHRVAEMQPLVPFASAILGLEEARRQMQPMDSPQTAATVAALARQIAEIRKSVESELKTEKKYPLTVANRAAREVNSLRDTLKAWFNFYNGYDPLFTWWLGDPYRKADQALESYGAFLREKLVGVKADDRNAIIGDPVGREALMDELAYAMIPYTPEELIAIAQKELAWCDAEMLRASRELGYGDDWHKALEYVKNQHVEPGKQPSLIRDLMREAIDFVEQHDLVTVPPLAVETLRMQMMSPERQLVNPFFLGGEAIIVSFPTNTMTQEQKLMSMRGNNIHFSRATVFHEMIPGHHLQGFMTARYHAYRAPFTTPFWVEGNALYWELLFWDLNFPKSPENRIGMLFWRMHRCARIIFSLGFHLGKMTPQQCIDLLVQRVGHEVDNATAEVRRSFDSSYGPLYQCAYLLGGLQFQALHRELVDSGRMTNRAFHDAILKEGAIPVEMVRAILTKQKLARDFVSHWKFYEP